MAQEHESQSAVTVVDDRAKHRYEATVDGQLAGYVRYREVPGAVELIHTEVDPAFEHHGVGTALAVFALDDVRAKGRAVVPVCPFITSYLKHHPEYQDLVARRPGA
jgi:uncharacterized protein